MKSAPAGSDPVRIRRARATDAGGLAELSTQLGYPATRRAILRRLASLAGRQEHAVFVAELSGDPPRELAGWVHVFLSRLLESDPEAEIGGLVVEETYRSRGIGQRLLAEAEQWARSKNCRSVRLRSNVIRTRAHAFYQKRGYQVIKSQKVFRKRL